MSTINEADSESLRRSINCIVVIVVLLQRELDELLQQKAGLKIRMRSLRRRLSSLRDEASHRTFKMRKYRRSQKTARRAQVGKLRQELAELRRACRIVFLELGGTATPDELYSAINRRGSFSFGRIKEKPIVAILRTLTSMAQPREATCSTNGSLPKWSYDPETSPFQRSS